MRIEDYLRRSAESHPHKAAVVAGDARLSYVSLDRQVDALAAGLTARGVLPGDRVVIFLDNGPEAVIALHGVLRAGAVFVLVNPTTKAGKLAFILNHCRASAIITRQSLLATAGPAVAQSPHVRSVIVVDGPGALEHPGVAVWTDVLTGASAPPRSVGTDHDLAAILYTSGSTGVPKGVMMTHHNLVAATSSIATYLENRPGDVILSVLPLSFGYGLTQLLTSCHVGATLVLEKSFAFPYAVLQTMLRESVTGFPLVPTIAAILVNLQKLPAAHFPSLRYLTNAAAALPIAHVRRLRETFPAAAIYSMYGMTECLRATYLPPGELDARPDSVGKAIPNTEVQVVDEEGRPVGPGVVGELVIRGGHVMRGYWDDPVATADRLRPRRQDGECVLHSGDLFRMDEDGYLYFVSRMDDVIKTRGEKVSPREVENVLYELPGVREAAVFGVPDPILGQAIHAAIVPVEEGCLTERAVLAHCARHLEDFMVPKSVAFHAELPKTASGKIHRRETRARVLGESLAAAHAAEA